MNIRRNPLLRFLLMIHFFYTSFTAKKHTYSCLSLFKNGKEKKNLLNIQFLNLETNGTKKMTSYDKKNQWEASINFTIGQLQCMLSLDNSIPEARKWHSDLRLLYLYILLLRYICQGKVGRGRSHTPREENFPELWIFCRYTGTCRPPLKSKNMCYEVEITLPIYSFKV